MADVVRDELTILYKKIEDVREVGATLQTATTFQYTFSGCPTFAV